MYITCNQFSLENKKVMVLNLPTAVLPYPCMCLSACLSCCGFFYHHVSVCLSICQWCLSGSTIMSLFACLVVVSLQPHKRRACIVCAWTAMVFLICSYLHCITACTRKWTALCIKVPIEVCVDVIVHTTCIAIVMWQWCVRIQELAILVGQVSAVYSVIFICSCIVNILSEHIKPITYVAITLFLCLLKAVLDCIIKTQNSIHPFRMSMSHIKYSHIFDTGFTQHAL